MIKSQKWINTNWIIKQYEILDNYWIINDQSLKKNMKWWIKIE